MWSNQQAKPKRDFQDFFQSPDNDEAIAGFMHGVLEASNNQMNLAVELTKLVVNKNPNNMKEEDIFSTFKKASDVKSQIFVLDNASVHHAKSLSGL